jgi:hypothetical protein
MLRRPWQLSWTPVLRLAALTLAILFAPVIAHAMSTVEFLASLSDAEVANFREWRQARQDYNDRLDTYWDAVERKRDVRRKKRAAKTPYASSDYVMSFPPVYKGPELSPALARKYRAFTEGQEKENPSPSRELPTVDDYLYAAKRVYNFVPERVSEKEFKRRYAEEALALGLSKEQVVRVYALETGGIGTYDMQAGIHPTKKTGRAISSALGYAQLLDANSVNELSKNGKTFINRLNAKLRSPGITEARRQALKKKIVALRHMYANAKRVPYRWSRHQAYAKTLEGRGMHALNIDADIGPMLQAMKLKGIKDFAARYDRHNMTGAEMELMNLSGPMTGIEMMRPLGLKAPVTNSFSRRAYYVNKMVIGLTGEQLLAELNRRMDDSLKMQGSQEFAAAFDEVRRSQRTAGR